MNTHPPHSKTLTAGLTRSLVVGVASILLVAGAEAEEPQTTTFSGSVRTEGSIPPWGFRLSPDDPWYNPHPTYYNPGLSETEGEWPLGNELKPKGAPSSFDVTVSTWEEQHHWELPARTLLKMLQANDGSPAGSYPIEVYFRVDGLITCPVGGCSPAPNATFHAKYGNVLGKVTLEDGTLLPEPVQVRADPGERPAGTEHFLYHRLASTRPDTGEYDFRLASVGAPATACPENHICVPVPVDERNNWGLPVLGDGGVTLVPPRPQGEYPKAEPYVLYYSNGPGALSWTIKLDEKHKQTVTVKSSLATQVDFKLTPEEYDEVKDHQRDNRDYQDDSPEGATGPCGESVLPGGAPSTGPHPVSLLTGNVFLDQTDVVLPGLRHDVIFRRSYNSYNRTDGVLGIGWNHDFQKRIEAVSNYILRLWLPNGTPEYFTDPDKDGSFAVYGNPYGPSTIQKTASGYHRDFRTGGYEDYDLGGRLLVRADRLGRAITLSYGANGNLSQVVTPEGRKLTLVYDSYGDRLYKVLGPEGLVAEYEYHYLGGFSPLGTVRYPDGTGYRFTYDSEGRLSTVSDLTGVVLDRHGVTRQWALTGARSGSGGFLGGENRSDPEPGRGGRGRVREARGSLGESAGGATRRSRTPISALPVIVDRRLRRRVRGGGASSPPGRRSGCEMAGVGFLRRASHGVRVSHPTRGWGSRGRPGAGWRFPGRSGVSWCGSSRPPRRCGRSGWRALPAGRCSGPGAPWRSSTGAR